MQGQGGRSVRCPHGPILGHSWGRLQWKGHSLNKSCAARYWKDDPGHGLHQFGKGGTPSRMSHATCRTALAGTLSGICATWPNSLNLAELNILVPDIPILCWKGSLISQPTISLLPSFIGMWNEQWQCCVDGKVTVGLALQWQCITLCVVYPAAGSVG